MDRSDELQKIFYSSGLPALLTVNRVQYYPPQDYTALRFRSNNFRIRALEIWDDLIPEKSYFRIYHAKEIAPEIKQLIDSLEGFKTKSSSQQCSDYFGNPEEIASTLGNLLTDENVKKIAEANPVYSRNSAYDGLALPDVDVSDANVLGRTFTWKELIAISEDGSEENTLRSELSKPGVYLQRSPDGKTRYVGSAYGIGGILGRWISHLTSNGDAKHLNFYVLENGYANVLFTVLEFTEHGNATERESRWKETLGTRNAGPYDGFRLNSN